MIHQYAFLNGDSLTFQMLHESLCQEWRFDKRSTQGK